MAKTHLQQIRISKFSGGRLPDPPLTGEGWGVEEEEGEGNMGYEELAPQ